MKSLLKRHTWSFLLAVCVFYLLLRQIEWQDIPRTLSNIPPHAVGIAFLAYLVFVLTKAWRFLVILGLPIPLKRLAPILAIQTFWTNLLPMRTGDLSYVYLLSQRERVSTDKSAASLIIGSVVDMLLLLGILVALGAVLYERFGSTLSATTLFILPSAAMLAIVTLCLPAFVAPAWLGEQLQHFELRLQHRLGGEGILVRKFGGVLTFLAGKTFSFLSELTRRPTGRKFLAVLATSAISLVLRFGFQWYLVRSMHIDLSLTDVVFALAFTGFCNLFPIQSVGGIGTVEAPWTWALISLGATNQEAIVSAMSLHVIVLSYSVGVGVLGWLVQKAGDEEGTPRPHSRSSE